MNKLLKKKVFIIGIKSKATVNQEFHQQKDCYFDK
jgi:hypothetical protein